MAEYQIEKVIKNEQSYQLICDVNGKKYGKDLPIIEGFEPQAGDTLSINRPSVGEVNISIGRGDMLLADFHVDRKSIKFDIYREEGVDKYASGVLQPNAVRRAKNFADKCSRVLDAKIGKVKIRQGLATVAFIGALASLGTDPELAQYMAPEDIKDPNLMQGILCGATMAASAVKGAGREVVLAAAQKYIDNRGIKMYGPDGKVTKIVAGLDCNGNPTGSFFNKDIARAKSGGRNG